jgi:arylsulfatase A-like enzyme
MTNAEGLMMKEHQGSKSKFAIPVWGGLRASSFVLRHSTRCFGLFLGMALHAAPPNILFIAVDDLRPDLGCYGAAHMKTPNLDRLAARGTLFERAYCQVAVCNPSRISLLSGTRPATNRVLDNQHFLREFLPDVVTLPQHFKNHGWHTVSLGKVFHHSEREPGEDPASWSEPAWHRGTTREWFDPQNLAELNRLKKLPEKERPRLIRGPPFEAADQPDDAYPDGATARKAIETLRRLKAKAQPFFLAVGFVKPHLTFSCPRKYWDLYPADSIRLPENYRAAKDLPPAALHDLYELRTYGGVPETGGISDDLALNLLRGYRACVSFVDAQIGRVLDELDRLGLRDHTIVVVWGDHGYHLGEHGLFTKMTNFEVGTRVPLILSAPGRKAAGRKSRALVELVDLYPTLAELAGLPAPAHLEGTSFQPLLDDPARPWKTAAFSEYARRANAKTGSFGRGPDTFMGRSVRTDRWRYTEWTDPGQQIAGRELYDHQNDPAENVNLANDPAHAEIVAQLAQTLRAGWRAALPPKH